MTKTMKRIDCSSVIMFSYFCLLTPTLFGSRATQVPDRIVQNLQEKYKHIQSFSANFKQVFQSRGVQLEQSGILMMKKPGKMYWEYQHPDPKFFVLNGDKTLFYIPKDKQLMVFEGKQDQIPLLFLLGRGNIQADFHAQFEKEDQSIEEGNLLIRLTPKRPQSNFSYLILEIIPSTYLIKRLSVIEPIGSRNDYILFGLQENVRISDGQFRLDVPSNVEVIRP